MNNPDEIKNLFKNNCQKKIGIFMKLISKVFESLRRRLIENQHTFVELTARIQELQSEIKCMNDTRVLKDAESIRSGPSCVPNQPTSLPPHRDPKKC